VVVGDFNPAVLHPYWFGARELLPPEQATEALETVQALMNEVMAFEAGWLSFQALPKRLAFTSKESASHLELRDLAMGTLTLLGEDPVTSIGLNRDAHYRMDTEAEWHEIGDRYAPNEPWAELTGGARAGLQRLVVQVMRDQVEPSPENLARGATNIHIGPSTEVQQNGVFLGINDHFQLGTDEEPIAAAEAVQAIGREWEPARERANLVARHIIG
jgi:hypothetical protein